MVHQKDAHVLIHVPGVYGAGMRRGRCGRKMMREGKMNSFLTSLTPSFLARYAYMLPVLLVASLGKRLKGSEGLGRRLPHIPIQTPPWEGDVRVSGETKILNQYPQMYSTKHLSLTIHQHTAYTTTNAKLKKLMLCSNTTVF